MGRSEKNTGRGGAGRREPRMIHALYRPFLRFFRTRRMRQFVELFGVNDATRIIDVGGGEFNWTLIEQQPHVTIVNLDVEDRTEGRFTYRRGDGTSLPFADNSFDIAYSNSVIEHVGGEREMAAFAAEIARVAPRYYVQTPYRWFPVEPHTLTVLLHFVPKGSYRMLAPWCGLHGWLCGRRATEHAIDGTDLLDLTRFRRLFPKAGILRERFLGLTKSLLAVVEGQKDPPLLSSERACMPERSGAMGDT